MDKPFWQSKKWYAGVVGVLVPVANKVFGWDLNTADILTITLPIIAYIIGQGFADGK